MRRSGSVDDLVNEAFRLAFFILGDRTSSIYVAMAAMDKLKVAATSQTRRTYYTPTGRPDYPAARTKINLSDLHLLQRLVYVESELFERLLERQQEGVRQEDLIIRYIKHLVRITTRHNSFYVTLGLCRLLYNYTTAESAEIYNLVLQDPDRMRDDYYYRSRKRRLMQEVKDRFGPLVRTQRGFRREERFHPQEDSLKYANLVKECLTRFTPWRSNCVLPRHLNPKADVIQELLFEESDPDEEHEVELNRIHTLIHPECFDRLITALNLDSTDRRLEIPYFFISTDEIRPAVDRFSPADLNEGELEAIRDYLDKNVRHRKEDRTHRLSLAIDGRRKFDFDLELASGVDFDLDDQAELVEIRSVGGDEEQDVPLAVCLLQHDDSGLAPLHSSARFGKRQRLGFNVIPSYDFQTETPRATLNLVLDHTSRARAALAYLRGIGQQIGQGYRASSGKSAVAPRMSRLLLKPVLAAIFVAVCVFSSWIYLHSRKSAIDSLPITQPEAQPDNQTLPASPPSFETQVEPESGNPRKQTGRTDARTQQATHPPGLDAEGTRAAEVRPVPRMLLNIKRVYVDALGDDSFSKELRENLLDGLRSGNRFEVVGKRDSADAVFRRSAGRPANDENTWSVGVELVNARGQVVWVLPSKPEGRTIPRDPAQASAAILRALLLEVSRVERKR